MFNVLYFQDQGYCQDGPVTLEMMAYLTHDYSIRKYSTTYIPVRLLDCCIRAY